MRQVAREKQNKSFQGVVSRGEKTLLHSDKKRSNSTRHWLWNPIQLSTTQLKKRNRVTLEGRAANVSVAKQWQTAGRQCCLAGLVKMTRLHRVSGEAGRGLQQANTTRQGLVQVYTANCWQMCKQTAQCWQPTPGPTANLLLLLLLLPWPERRHQDKQIYCFSKNEE